MGFSKEDPNINRAGRKPLSESFKSQRAALALMDAESLPIIKKLIEGAKAGKISHIKLFIERYVPILQRVQMDIDNSPESDPLDLSKLSKDELEELAKLQEKLGIDFE